MHTLPVPRSRISAPSRATVASAARVLGALALVAVGVDHIEQYSAGSYSVIPKVGTLFALNFAAATPIGIALLVLPRRLLGRALDPLRALLAIGGIAIAAGSLTGLLISENGGLFGFAEQGYRPAIVLSIVLEVATVAFLCTFLVLDRARGMQEARTGRWRS